MTEIETKALREDLRKANNNIKSLCGTVNRFSHQLGLGRKKVYFEDWVEPVTNAMKRITQ